MSLRTLLQRFRRPAPAGGEILPPVSRAHPVGTATLVVLPDISALRPPLPQRPPVTRAARARMHLERAAGHVQGAMTDLDRWTDSPDSTQGRVHRVAAHHQFDAAQDALATARRTLTGTGGDT